MASSKKTKLLGQLLNNSKQKELGLSFELLEKSSKDNAKCFSELMEHMKGSYGGSVFAYPQGNKLEGSFAPSWVDLIEKTFSSSSGAEESIKKEIKSENGEDEKSEVKKENGDSDVKKSYKLMNLTPEIYNHLARKDDTELDIVKKSSQLCTRVMKYACVKRMEDIIDEDLCKPISP